MKNKTLIVLCLIIAFLIGFIYGHRIATDKQKALNNTTLHK